MTGAMNKFALREASLFIGWGGAGVFTPHGLMALEIAFEAS